LELDNRYSRAKRAGIISLIINLFLAFFKIIVGFLYSSKALLADGVHSVSDIASTFIVMISLRLSHTPVDEDHPYGHGKAEAIGSSILAIILIITGVFIVRDAFVGVYERQVSIPGRPALWIAFISIIIKEALYRYTIKIGKSIKSSGLIADAHHHRSDAFSSIAALIGIFGARLGYSFFDPLAGLIVALFIIKAAFSILSESINELMDRAPENRKIEKYRDIGKNVEGVIEVCDIKLRRYGSCYVIDLSVVVNDKLTVYQGHEIASNVRSAIKKSEDNVAEVMVHVDPETIYLKNQISEKQN